ncbi:MULTISPECIES: outer membrane protein OmpX [Pectobacterium]|uniref:Outer membrane protein X n=1 Tax=Pectobacterium punjabense TaxID=2108399 RepID=A0ABX6L1M0_9GAMM|nr:MULTISPECIES: outer membrane protein OmpX [Pectobacterium]GKW09917.1 outer membrane protein X [Pectobacterium carotovorum subsp. carotovorum]MBN3136935.1 outer membrane protein OmpX [Pectobacterium punjabense]MBS4430380.1 outer membrane protein OmpX [Pectobacterium punjabense]MBT9186583.1 outer membrane protein OmpX [Pectobacterium punjabense]MCE5379501.1 outer membrane protein OmpX [Pectobacterium punjabense]
MKKIACLSALACVLAVGAGSAFAGQSTVTAGYAQGDAQGVQNKVKGFNLKYRYEQDNNPLGVISSFTYLEKNGSDGSDYNKGQYMGFTAGPAYRLNDWASLYGVVGLSHGKVTNNATNGLGNSSNDDYGFTYGAGVQFNPIQDVALDVGYEQSRIRNVDVGAWAVGVGYRF